MEVKKTDRQPRIPEPSRRIAKLLALGLAGSAALGASAPQEQFNNSNAPKPLAFTMR